jgi:alanine dehydrogenase
MGILYLTEADVRQVLTMDRALPAVESAFRKLALEEAENQPRRRCRTDGVMMHVLPAGAKTLGALGLKVYTTGPSGAKFHVYLYDAKVGGLTTIIEADYLGQMRTGAASGVATKKLANPNASTLGIFGTGKQARTQVLAVCKVRPIRTVKVYSRDAERREAFALQMREETGVEVHAVNTPQEAADAEIICTATASREPVLFGEWLKPGVHLNIVGSNFLAKTEIDIEVVRRANFITVDSLEQARIEAGDFVAAIEQHVLHWSSVREFAPVLLGRYPGRETESDITLFKSLGLGIEDIAVAVKVAEAARGANLGVMLPVG